MLNGQTQCHCVHNPCVYNFHCIDNPFMSDTVSVVLLKLTVYHGKFELYTFRDNCMLNGQTQCHCVHNP